MHHHDALIAQHTAGGPTGPDGVDRDPRCWSCGKILVRGCLTRPYSVACADCDALTVAPAGDGLFVQISAAGVMAKRQMLDKATPEAVARIAADLIDLHRKYTAGGEPEEYLEPLALHYDFVTLTHLPEEWSWL